MNSERSAEWRIEMDKELEKLDEYESFIEVDRPEGVKLLDGRWVCVIKDTGDLKARWVIKEYEQVSGIDYNEVFAPLIHKDTI